MPHANSRVCNSLPHPANLGSLPQTLTKETESRNGLISLGRQGGVWGVAGGVWGVAGGVKYSNTVYTKMRVEVIVGGLRKYNKWYSMLHRYM